MGEKILIIDDEKEITDLLEVFLHNENYQIFKGHSAEEAIELIKNVSFDLAIIDVMLPDGNGFDLCKLIREKYTYPIIMLTSRTEGMDRVTGLSLGADDYVTKPFLPIELVARVKAQLRRVNNYDNKEQHMSETLAVTGLFLNKTSHECKLNDEIIKLTPTEFSILFTASRHETVVENEELVSGFIENKSDYSGKFIAVRDSKLVIEKSVSNSLEDRTNLEFDLTPESDIYVCYDEIDYFFSAIAGEHKRYEQVTYDEFLSQRSKTFDRENNVLIWSSDKKQIDHLVITEWVE